MTAKNEAAEAVGSSSGGSDRNGAGGADVSPQIIAQGAEPVKTWLRTLLNDDAPPEIPTDYAGPWADAVLEVAKAHAAGGRDAARRVFGPLAKADPRLAELMAGDGGEGDGWKFFTLADAYQARPPLQYVADGLLPLPSLSIVYGAPGSLKSMLLLDLALCVAAGKPWLPPLPGLDVDTTRPTTASPVAWLDFDNGKRTTHDRVEAIGRGHDLPTTTPFFYTSLPSPWLDTSEPGSVDDLTRRILDLGAKMVIIDCLGVVLGKADENSPEMSRVMGNLRQMAETTGAAVVTIHHQRKSTGNSSRAGDALRGHSSIEASLDLALSVDREDGSDNVRVKSTKSRNVPVTPFGLCFPMCTRPTRSR